MQVEKRALQILREMKKGKKPNQENQDLESFGQALHFLDSNNLATGITVERAGEEKKIVGYSIDDSFSITVSGFEFLEKNNTGSEDKP